MTSKSTLAASLKYQECEEIVDEDYEPLIDTNSWSEIYLVNDTGRLDERLRSRVEEK